MVTNRDSKGREAFKNGDDPFSTTSNDSGNSEGELVIEVNTSELIDTAITSIVGGIATGMVTKKLLEDKK